MSDARVLVVDDEPLARRRLVRMLGEVDWVGRIDEAGDVREASRQLATLRPDVLLLDIQMPGGSGFDVLALSEHMPPAVVFVTAFDHHALQAFEARAIDYLTKPIEPGRFAVAMARARQAVAARGQSERIAELQETVSALRHALAGQAPRREDFWVKRRDEFIRIAMGDVIRFQAERDYVRIHVPGADYLYQDQLSAIEQRLDPDDFLRIHRSSIVRCGAVTRIKPAAFSSLVVVLVDGAELRVGRTYTATVRRRFMGKPG